MYLSIKKIAKIVDKSPHIIDRIVKAYSIKPVKITKGKSLINTYLLDDVKKMIDYEASIKPMPKGMVLITDIKKKYSLSSINWTSVWTLPDAPQPKGKAFDSGERLRPYYSEKEWDEYLSKLKAAGHPLLIGRTKIKGPEIQRNREKELKIDIHPERQKAYQQAANARLLNKAFMVMQ